MDVLLKLSSITAKIQSLEAKAADKNQSTKPNSIVCDDCDGNGKQKLWLRDYVPNSVLNAEVPELILLITSTDNIKPVACVGFAEKQLIPFVSVIMGSFNCLEMLQTVAMPIL
ncbi:hypothetical protein J1N35_002948 [Gossypium stocksii]|uniref:Uncharacterized protein n=1 Tax=Gossypium stocksii TaxID=47602 RepID=A0A9D3WN15_9ROSI|nr:hypothetical protein J1N35_002948 [Gossypium stocksii]